MSVGFRIATAVIRLHYLVLAPWVTFTIPATVLLGSQVLVLSVISIVGLLGTLGRRRILANLASFALIALIIGGKAGGDVVGASSPDTAILLAQFVAVISFMEASRVVLSFDDERSELNRRDDDISSELRAKLVEWARGQLAGQARIMILALGLSLVLLVVGGFTAISINQLGFTAGLVLVVVGVLVFLITQRREPEVRTTKLT